MLVTKCRNCEYELKRTIEYCPQCGAIQEQSSVLRWLFFFCIVVLAYVAFEFPMNMTERGNSSLPHSTAEDVGPTIQNALTQVGYDGIHDYEIETSGRLVVTLYLHSTKFLPDSVGPYPLGRSVLLALRNEFELSDNVDYLEVRLRNFHINSNKGYKLGTLRYQKGGKIMWDSK